MERDFKGVWIPKIIYLNKDLSWSEKLLLSEIDSLSLLDKGCFATNEHFAEHLDLSKDRVSKLISSLNKKKYIEVELIFRPETKIVEKRLITTRGYRRKQLEGIGENNHTPIGENNYYNNTSSFTSTFKNTKEENHKQINIFFDECMKIYPRPSGKSSVTYKAKKNAYELGDKFIKAIKNFEKEYQKTEEKFIPMPSTFWNTRYQEYLNTNQAEEQEKKEIFLWEV